MRINKQTASELIIVSVSDLKALVLPLVMLSIALLGGIWVLQIGQLSTAVFLVLAGIGAYALSMIYNVLLSETLTLDKTADQVRCVRKTLLGTKRWQLPLSTVQNVIVGNAKRRYTKYDGNKATLWSYNLKFITSDNQTKQTLYEGDSDSVDAACQAISKFAGPFAMAEPNQSGRLSDRNPRMRITSEYQSWRETIFNLHPGQAGGSENKLDQVYGVLMDIGMFDQQLSTSWAMSLTAFLSGEASFRPTPGGGMVGLGGDPRVAQVAQEIVQIAQTLLSQASPIEDRALPEPDLVQFLFLTPGGVYGVADDVNRLQKQPDNPFNPMLNKFSFIRQVADQLIDQNNAPSP